jgi:hypothetical protein
MTQVFKNDVIRLGHGVKLTYFEFTVNWRSFLYLTATINIRGNRSSTLPSACGR